MDSSGGRLQDQPGTAAVTRDVDNVWLDPQHGASHVVDRCRVDGLDFEGIAMFGKLDGLADGPIFLAEPKRVRAPWVGEDRKDFLLRYGGLDHVGILVDYDNAAP